MQLSREEIAAKYLFHEDYLASMTGPSVFYHTLPAGRQEHVRVFLAEFDSAVLDDERDAMEAAVAQAKAGEQTT
jgi:hypothetical protein